MREVKKTNGVKQIFLALIGVFSNGLKLPPLLIFKSKSQISIPDDLKPYLLVRNNGITWNTSDFFLEWLNRILFNLKLPNDTYCLHYGSGSTSYDERCS